MKAVLFALATIMGVQANATSPRTCYGEAQQIAKAIGEAAAGSQTKYTITGTEFISYSEFDVSGSIERKDGAGQQPLLLKIKFQGLCTIDSVKNLTGE